MVTAHLIIEIEDERVKRAFISGEPAWSLERDGDQLFTEALSSYGKTFAEASSHLMEAVHRLPWAKGIVPLLDRES